MEIDQARLLTLYAAWKMDTEGKRAARQSISAIKVVAANMVMDVLDRAIQVHGSLGMTDDTPLAALWRFSRMLRLADGPDEVHKMVLARRELNRWAKRAEAAAAGELNRSTPRGRSEPRGYFVAITSTPPKVAVTPLPALQLPGRDEAELVILRSPPGSNLVPVATAPVLPGSGRPSSTLVAERAGPGFVLERSRGRRLRRFRIRCGLRASSSR